MFCRWNFSLRELKHVRDWGWGKVGGWGVVKVPYASVLDSVRPWR